MDGSYWPCAVGRLPALSVDVQLVWLRDVRPSADPVVLAVLSRLARLPGLWHLPATGRKRCADSMQLSSSAGRPHP